MVQNRKGCENVVESLKVTKLASELSGCDHLGFVAKRQEDYVVDASDEKLKRWFAFLNHHMGNEGAEGMFILLAYIRHRKILIHFGDATIFV